MSRNTIILGGIGLVLVGLLSGILFMLVFRDAGGTSGSLGPVVERVQLGSQEPLRLAHDSVPPMPSGMGEALKLNEIFRHVAQDVTPAVVFIQVETAGSLIPRDLFHRFDSDDRGHPFEDPAPRQSVGSGVVINPNGYIITNNHVVENAATILVTFTDKRQYEARIVGIDTATDLAMLKIDDVTDLPTVHFGDSDSVQVGDWVLAIGNPFRLTSTVTAGIVGALGRQVNIIEDEFGIEDFIQTDAAINPGNSGGALVNLQGELIGIATAIATESGSYEGYGFAVPTNLMRRVAEDLIAFGEVRRGFMGVVIGDLTAGQARKLGVQEQGGVLLERVWDDGAADRAGLKNGDVVLAIGNRPVGASNELQRTIAQHRPGDRIAVQVWRSGESRSFEVELLGRDDPSYASWRDTPDGERIPPVIPDPGPEAPETLGLELTEWGIGLSDLTRKERKAFGDVDGVYVSSVQEGSVSGRAGLPQDVLISRIDGQAVRSVSDIVRALGRGSEYGEPVLMRVKRRDGATAFYELDRPAGG